MYDVRMLVCVHVCVCVCMHVYDWGGPILVSHLRKCRVVNHAQTTTEKTGKLTIGLPCRGEIHDVDYCTSLFVSVVDHATVKYTA